ncbi:MAG: peptidylprolyl isomerase [Gammaproteobacteria bacterium]|nr:peptidylprolyl isomerase [Gammaproteobacteria bacterium]
MPLRRFLLPALLLLLTARVVAAAPELVDRVVAVVNDSVITLTELEDRVQLVKAQLQRQETRLPPENVLQRQVLERMVLEELQMQLAAKTGIIVDDIELNNALREIARRNDMNLLEFRQTIEKDGYEFSRLREDIRVDMTTARLRERQINNRITITDQEVDSLLEREAQLGDAQVEYHLGHILVALPEAASPVQIQAAEEKVRDIAARLEAGADFAQTAIAESDGQQALAGGDLGWRDAGQIPRLFVDAVVGMEVGEVSSPIRSPSGFHLVKLLDKRGDEKRYITQTRVRHILITPTAVISSDEARQRLERLRDRIANGESFAALAQANSVDARSASQGGDLGWVSPGELVPVFEEAMNALPVGGLSQPVRSQFGWHLIQVEDRRQQDVTEEARRNRARMALFRRKVEEETQLWARRLRDEAYVDYRLEDE